jgi:phosphatidylglycerophosphatase A
MEKAVAVQWLRKTVASVFFVGYLPASGTFASALVVILLFLTGGKSAFAGGEAGYWLFTLGVTACSFYFANRGKEYFGKADSSRIVIDEVAGQLITFLFVPLSARTLIAGFVLFRFFDIVKPYPVYKMELLEDGVGVTMDDAVAGVMANASLIIILAGYHWVKRHIQ